MSCWTTLLFLLNPVSQCLSSEWQACCLFGCTHVIQTLMKYYSVSVICRTTEWVAASIVLINYWIMLVIYCSCFFATVLLFLALLRRLSWQFVYICGICFRLILNVRVITVRITAPQWVKLQYRGLEKSVLWLWWIEYWQTWIAHIRAIVVLFV